MADTAAQQPRQAPNQEEAPRMRVSVLTALFMMIVALLFDMLQFFVSFLHALPVIGNAAAIVFTWFLGVIATISFALWFTLLGVSYFGKNSTKKLTVVIGATVAEMVPIINALPAITLGVAAIILIARSEDSKGASGLLSLAVTAGLAAVPGGQVAAGARMAQTAATAQKTQAAAATTKKVSQTKREASALVSGRQSDVGPGATQRKTEQDIHTPFRKAETARREGFAQPYVPANDNEQAEEEGRWAA